MHTIRLLNSKDDYVLLPVTVALNPSKLALSFTGRHIYHNTNYVKIIRLVVNPTIFLEASLMTTHFVQLSLYVRPSDMKAG